MRVAVIGAGAAGCFCAIELRRRLPDASVEVFEAGRTPLAKVAITGGGRCNLTNSFDGVANLAEVYPRGTQLMKRALRRFDQTDTCAWFEQEGVRLTLQSDHCVFPASQDAMQIVGTLTTLMRREGVILHTQSPVRSIAREGETFTVTTDSRNGTFDRVVVTTGGSPKASGLSFLEPLGLEMQAPVPSLYTLRIDDSSLRSLMGITVDEVTLSIPGTKMRSEGILLITDWGISGPATLKLSSYAARLLAEKSWRSPVAINWMGGADEQSVRNMIAEMTQASGRKMIVSTHPQALSTRLWEHLVQRAGLRSDLRWNEMGSKGTNRLTSTLTCDCYQAVGRAAFKEEFVTCGGVSLSEIDINTLQCKKHPGLYFAGEVLDIDAVTGGFNLQAAWTTGYICAQSIAIV